MDNGSHGILEMDIVAQLNADFDTKRLYTQGSQRKVSNHHVFVTLDLKLPE